MSMRDCVNSEDSLRCLICCSFSKSFIEHLLHISNYFTRRFAFCCSPIPVSIYLERIAHFDILCPSCTTQDHAKESFVVTTLCYATILLLCTMISPHLAIATTTVSVVYVSYRFSLKNYYNWFYSIDNNNIVTFLHR